MAINTGPTSFGAFGRPTAMPGQMGGYNRPSTTIGGGAPTSMGPSHGAMSMGYSTPNMGATGMPSMGSPNQMGTYGNPNAGMTAGVQGGYGSTGMTPGTPMNPSGYNPMTGYGMGAPTPGMINTGPTGAMLQNFGGPNANTMFGGGGNMTQGTYNMAPTNPNQLHIGSSGAYGMQSPTVAGFGPNPNNTNSGGPIQGAYSK